MNKRAGMAVILLMSLYPPLAKAQHFALGTGGFVNEIRKTHERYNFDYSRPPFLSLSLYLHDLKNPTRKHGWGFRYAQFKINRETIDLTLVNQFNKQDIHYTLTTLLLNHRLKLFPRAKTANLILNNSLGCAISKQEPLNGGEDCFGLKYVYIPGLELHARLWGLMGVYGLVQYHRVLGDSDSLFPFSSMLTFELGFSW